MFPLNCLCAGLQCRIHFSQSREARDEASLNFLLFPLLMNNIDVSLFCGNCDRINAVLSYFQCNILKQSALECDSIALTGTTPTLPDRCAISNQSCIILILYANKTISMYESVPFTSNWTMLRLYSMCGCEKMRLF
jgi:hypothetical protein